MHAVFIPYGKRSEVELLLRDMEAQKHKLICRKDGFEKSIYIQGQIRLLPFGVYESIFPKEDMNMVLHSLDFDRNRYNVNKFILAFLRKTIKCEPIPKYKKEKYFLWIRENVNIIPLGIRHDTDIIDPTPGELQGWKHEAI